MTINSFKYSNKSLDWHLEKVHFKNLTLLVGSSGVGKSLILNAILQMKRIASGSSLNGVYWNIEFTSTDGKEYKWEGEFENKGFAQDLMYRDPEKKKNKSKILYENISQGDAVIVKRVGDDINFNGQSIVKLSPHESVVDLLKREDAIQPIYDNLKCIIYSDQSESMLSPRSLRFFKSSKVLKKYKNLQSIQNAEIDVDEKLYIVSKTHKKTFDLIKERFIDVFPQVVDIKIDPIIEDDVEEDVPDFIRQMPLVQIREKGVQEWINQFKMSSGMYRTLMHISELFLCSEGTVILIDEFENSLGVNCLDELTGDMLSSKRNIQFIITSHHPYIINNIGFDNWKIVTRTAGKVSANDARKFNLGKSKHEAFTQLINLEAFNTGRLG